MATFTQGCSVVCSTEGLTPKSSAAYAIALVPVAISTVTIATAILTLNTAANLAMPAGGDTTPKTYWS
ncbi:MAG: hypothetical protein HQL74_07275 [Magnetococcales bacterium]|nr:hypothetical protein [Magnetococcales bacterium]